MKYHDLIIEYKAGEPIGFVRSMTHAGRHFLSDNVKGRRVNNSAICNPKELLALIAKLNEANLSAYWRTK